MIVYSNPDWLSFFAKGEKLEGVFQKYPGVLYSSKEEYNEVILKFYGAFVNLYKYLLLTRDKKKKESIKQEIARLGGLFLKFLEGGDIQTVVQELDKQGSIALLVEGKKVKDEVVPILDHTSKSELFDIYGGRFSQEVSGENFSLPVFYVSPVGIESDFEELKLRAETEAEKRLAHRYRKMAYNYRLFIELKKYTKDPVLIDWLDRSIRLLSHYASKRLEGANFTQRDRIKEYILAYYLSIMEMSGVKLIEEEGELQTRHPVVSKISVGERINSPEYILKKAIESETGLTDEGRINAILENLKKEEDFRELLELLGKLYPQEKGDEEKRKEYTRFMRSLGKAVKDYLEDVLKGKSEFLNGYVFYKKDYLGRIEKTIYYWTSGKDVRLLFVYDSKLGKEDIIKHFANNFVSQLIEKDSRSRTGKAINLKQVLKDGEGVYHVESFDDIFVYINKKGEMKKLFYFLKWLENKNENKNKTHSELILFMLQFSAFMGALTLLKKEGIFYVPIFLLKRGGENKDGKESLETYNFWNMARNFLYAYGYPAQTLAGPKLSALKKTFIDHGYAKRNIQRLYALLSASKRGKRLELLFSEDSDSLLPRNYKARAYLIVEHSGPELLNTFEHPELPELRSAVYLIYKVDIDGEQRSVVIEPYEDDRGRSFFPVLAGSIYFKQDLYNLLQKWSEENNAFVYLITTSSKSSLMEVFKEYKDFVFPVFYRYSNTPVPLAFLKKQERKDLKKRKRKEKDGGAFHSTGMFLDHYTLRLALDLLGVKGIPENMKSYIGFTSILPSQILMSATTENEDVLPRFNWIVHLHLSFFFYENMPETQWKIFRLALLAWLRFNTEVNEFPYSKPKFLQRRYDECKVRRKGYTFTVDPFSLIVESLYLTQEGLKRIEMPENA